MGMLGNVLGGQPHPGGGMSPVTMALLGVLAYRTFQGKGRLGEMLGRSPAQEPASQPTGGFLGGLFGGNAATDSRARQAQPTTPDTAPAGGLGGLLGGFLGTRAAGGMLSGGLNDLLRQFRDAGHGDKAQSWIGNGTNQPISPGELEQVLGPDKIAWLVQETGLSREQLLAGLSHELPAAVDKLTPDGRLPTPQEAAKML
jgi:uncharacterized protein YidB (DUF937 family)